MKAHLRLLTPAFIGSARPWEVDPFLPFRPSSVRGVLRSWFRVAMAAILRPRSTNPDDQQRMIDELRRIESLIFGDTERRSRVDVRPPQGGKMEDYKGRCPDPTRQPGLCYLGYGLFEEKGPREGKPQAVLTKKDDPIIVEFSLRGPELAGLEELLGATLWLWVHFGGIGARSRRGFGSLALCPGSEFPWSAQSPNQPALDRQALLDRLMEGLDHVTDVYRRFLSQHSRHSLDIGDPHPSLRTLDGIETLRTLPLRFSTPDEALERTGRLFRDFRSTLRRNALGMPPLSDYFEVKASLRPGAPPPRLVQRAAFGLPLPFFFRSLQNAKTNFVLGQKGRMPSPLHMRVHALAGENDYAMVLINWAESPRANILLGQDLLQDGNKDRKTTTKADIIGQFITWAVREAERAPQVRVQERK